MLLWSYPAVITDVIAPARFTAELDLGCKWYHPATVTIAGVRPRTMDKLAALLPPGTRVLLVAEHITGDGPLRAHVALEDGTDLATALTGRPHPPTPVAAYGGTWAKVWTYPALVTHVEDADTIVAKLNMGVTTRYANSVRVGHINAPEKRTNPGDAATAWARDALPQGAAIDIRSRRLEKYGRILGDIEIQGIDYATALLAVGHAVPYEGGPR